MYGSRFQVEALGFSVRGLAGSGFRYQGSGFNLRGWGSRFRGEGVGLGAKIQNESFLVSWVSTYTSKHSGPTPPIS